MKQLQEGQVYAVSGGFFKAIFNQERGKWELWTDQGLSGHVIGRTGFDVDDNSNLYDRVFNFETGQMEVWVESHYSVEDLEEAREAERGLAAVRNRQMGR